MGVKTYQAYTMTEALTAAKRDLGADAVILDTRTFKRGGMLGVGRRTIFELTATSGDRAELSPRSSETRPVRVAARHAYAKRPTAATASAAATAVRATAPNVAHTRRLAQAMAETHQRETRGLAVPTAPAAAPQPRTADAPPAHVARRFILTPADVAGIRGRRAARLRETQSPSPAHAAVPRIEPPRFGHDAMQEELSAIKTMVGQVLQRQTATHGVPGADMPPKLFGMYLELVGQDLSEELAEQIVNAVRGELGGGSGDDESAVRDAVLRHLTRLVPAVDPAIGYDNPDDRPLTIALIGPTGVGKTTTLAKLAASYKLKQNRKVGLVTCDTYRIAAVDQLRTYANIIGLPLEVALTPTDVRQAVTALADCDVILIDTAGRGPNDRGRLDELSSCVAAADPHEVHLVLSSTSSERVLLREAEAFAEVGADRVVLTKLDEAVSFGVLINVMQSIGKKLSFMTTGQEVPDHIEVGRPRRLAELVLGGALST